MGKVISWLAVIGLGFVESLAIAGTLSKLWSWFLAPQYGQGPTYAAWYGITVLFGVLALRAVQMLKKEDDFDLHMAWAHTVGTFIVLAVSLGVAWTTGQMFGWL